MPLSPLSLNITTGVVGRPFSATISGQSSGSTVEVIGYDGTPGFSTVNGRVLHSGLPYQVNTVVLRETLPGEGFRDSRIDIVADGIALGLAGLPAALETMPGYPSARQVGTSVIGDGVAAPASNLTATAGSAGALTGSYYYACTYVTALGETDPWPGTAVPVALSSQRASLSAIPIGPAGVTARRIYRTKAASPDPKDYYLVDTIADNATTTYTDNKADTDLGAPASWAPSNLGNIPDSRGGWSFRLGGTSTSLGLMNGGAKGYANVSIGNNAMEKLTSGRRNVAMGVYALQNVTIGQRNTAIGTHAGNGLTVGQSNTFYGYAAGGVTTDWGNFNVFVGDEAGGGAGATGGSSNIAIGYRALQLINTADNCMGIGQFAGRYANTSRQMFIDTGGDRTNIATAMARSLIYAKGEGTEQAQVMNLNAGVRVGAYIAVAALPAASAANAGRRFTVSDATVAYTSANVGATVAGGGSNTTPVFCNGSAWVIG